MPKEIRMPKLSDTMEEGVLIAWRKRPGDPIKRGEILADIETDKADMEFESYTEGTIQSLVIEAGTTVPVGTLICVIRLPGESEEQVASAVASAEQAPMPAVVPPPQQQPGTPPATAPVALPSTPVVELPAPASGPRIVVPITDDGRIRATPRARRIAEEKSLDLTEIRGGGPAGAIVVRDVEQYLKELEAHESEGEGVRATPLALRMAGEIGVDLELVKGSGPGGRITKSDLLEHVASERKVDNERASELFRGAQQLSQKRKALIRNMVRSKAEAPHFYVSMGVQTDSLKQLRDHVNEESADRRPHLTYTHFIIKASALALERFPDANATYRAEEQQVALYEAINIGLAVDVQDELVAPTVKDCQGKSIFQLAEDANGLIQRARMRKLQPRDYADGTFTISNLGMFGVDMFYAIITPPQSSILSVGSIEQRPLVREGEIVIGSMTNLGLSVDHRVLDGVKASQFLAEIARLLENPEELVQDGHSFGS